MKNRTALKTTALAAAVSAALATPAVAGQLEGGDMLLKFGWAQVSPAGQPNTGFATVDGTPATALGEDLVSVSDGQAAGISFTYMFNPIVGIEVLASTPFEHDIKAENGLTGLGLDKIGSTKHLPPTIQAQFFPLGDRDTAWQPYVGIGVNYTWFHDEKLTNEAEAGLATTSSKFSLKDSVGIAASVGLDWYMTDNWILNASVMWVDINTEAEIKNTALGNVEIRDIEIDPWVYRVNIGYRF